MGIPVLIIGKSGTGKSTSMRTVADNPNFNLIQVVNKPLPFKGNIPKIKTDDYTQIAKALKGSQAKSIIIDDAGYLITNQFMRNHSTTGAGNAVFTMYNNLADQFWTLLQFIQALPEDKIVYIVMHEDADESGNYKPKTIGKLLDEKVCIEGLFTIALRSVFQNGNYHFVTQSDGKIVAKSPMGMFGDLLIDNDLLQVDNAIREYYDIITDEKREEGQK